MFPSSGVNYVIPEKDAEVQAYLLPFQRRPINAILRLLEILGPEITPRVLITWAPWSLDLLFNLQLLL